MSEKIILTLTVDWEGASLKQENLDAMKVFQKKFPDYPVTHFICPSYYTRGEDPVPITEKIQSVLKPGDEIGLHIHCWYTLMDLFAKRHITTPTWLPGNDPGDGVPYDGGTKMDYGHDVPLGLYTVEEITATLAGGRQLLATNGLIGSTADCPSFRCGGWMACDKVFTALVNAGFKNDASGAPANFNLGVYQWIQTNWGVDYPLFDWLYQMWGTNYVSSPAFLVNSKSRAAYPRGVLGIGDPDISPPAIINGIVEVPDTGSLADYNTRDDLKQYIDTAVDAPTDEVYISLGFHQETATDKSVFDPPSTNIEVLTWGLEYLQSVTQQVEVLTRRDAAERFQASQAKARERAGEVRRLAA
jgi:hypothetical protein